MMVRYTLPLAAITVLLLGGCKPHHQDVAPAKEGVPANEMSQNLLSVLPREREVFATNPSGIYRANLADKTWHKLTLPDSMPPAGALVQNPKAPTDLFYFANKGSVLFHAPDAKDKKFGLYQSADAGRTWKLISENDRYSEVFIHPDGNLYAVISGIPDADGKKSSNELAASDDKGKTWKTILKSDAWYVGDIFADPDHPGLVCVKTNFIRTYVMQATDSNYSWKNTVEWEWEPAHVTNESFFNSFYYTGSTLYMVQATLENYFKYDFKNGPWLQAFQIVPEKNTFDFKKDAPKSIKVNVSFLQASVTVKVADQDEKNGLWGIRILTPSGARKSVDSFLEDKLHHAQDRPKLIAELQAGRELKLHPLAVDQTYSRNFDLSDWYDFPESGSYKVQLVYEGDMAKQIDDNAWSGGFGSEVFTVNIK